MINSAYGGLAPRRGGAAAEHPCPDTGLRADWRHDLLGPTLEPVAGGGDFRTARRIAVYGVTGSGKTRAAADIGAVTGLPWHAVDELTWEPGWMGVPADEQRRRIEAICRGDAWILDAIYSTWADLVLDRVEVIVALDYPRWLSYGRLLRRTGRRMITREPVCNGNHETVRNVLARDSILWFHFRSFRRKRARVRAWEDDLAAPAVQRFTGPRQLASALARPTPPRGRNRQNGWVRCGVKRACPPTACPWSPAPTC